MVPCLACLPFYASAMGSSLTSVGDFAGGFWETRLDVIFLVIYFSRLQHLLRCLALTCTW